MPEFMTGWPFMIAMFVALLVLVGVMIFLRSNKRDED